jgi:hypothetical protein
MESYGRYTSGHTLEPVVDALYNEAL